MKANPPVHVGILIHEGVVLIEAAAIAEALRFANRVADRRGEAQPFVLTFLPAGGAPITSLSGLLLSSDRRARRALDVLVVPGFDFLGRRDLATRLDALSDSIAIIRREARHAAIWSICSGAFLTAEAGLLNGRCATTTWWLGGLFTSRYPSVKLKLDQAIVEDGALVTSGAVAASFQVAVRLIERMASPELARMVARLMLLDTSSTLQSPFMQANEGGIYSGILDDLRKAGGDELIEKARTFMARGMHERFRIESLADRLHVTSRTLLRRFRRATGTTPLAFLQSIRLERARALLETTSIPIKQVIERVGYIDESAFRRLFRRQVGVSMTDYRRRFGFRARGHSRSAFDRNQNRVASARRQLRRK